MTHLRINTMPFHDDYCFLDTTPLGAEETDFKMSIGEPMGADYPQDPRVFMSDDFPGVQLPDVVGNTRSLFVTSMRVKDVVERVVTAPVEYLPLAIYNHKKRLASADYFIINPIGTVDCLDLAKSDVRWHGADIVRIKDHVLDPGKLAGVPDLFRIKEDPRAYVMSVRLAQALAPLDPTNLLVFPLPP